MVFAFLLLFCQPSHAFTSAKAVEAELRFQHKVELQSLSRVKETIEDQLRFMAGAMAHLKSPAASRFDHQISDIRIETKDGRIFAHYSYRGTVLLSKNTGAKLQFPLPIRPWEIYEASIKNLRSWRANPCTDEYFPEKKYFYYFWSPARAGCDEFEGRDYSTVNGQLMASPNTTLSFPEYERLPDNNGRIEIHLLMGMNEENGPKNPMDTSNQDANAVATRKIARQLWQMGFSSLEWTTEEVKALVKDRANPYPYVAEFKKSYTGKRAKEVVIRLVYGDSENKHRTSGMPAMIRDAVQNAAVMIWDGHSGVGQDCGLPSIYDPNQMSFSLNMERYQIFQFNTCSSYSYYNRNIMAFKADVKRNLDLITTGLETPFKNGHLADVATIRAIDNWVQRGIRTSYQTLTRRMENENLVGVTGDEDNASCTKLLLRPL